MRRKLLPEGWGYGLIQPAIILLALASIAGWLTHVVVCFKDQNWLLLIAGAIGAPLGAIHGWGIWFGWWG